MLYIIQNDPEVPLGEYGRDLNGLGVTWRLFRPFLGEALPELEAGSAVLVLGGAMGVHDLEEHPFLLTVKKFVHRVVEQDVPFLGICLGGQLLADVMGGAVTGKCQGEKGSLPVMLTVEGLTDPLFAGVGESFVTFQWHNDTFATPPGGVRLADSPACRNQAFRIGSWAYGLQFHPEVDGEIVAAWSRADSSTSSESGELVADFVAKLAPYRSASRRILENFLNIAGLPFTPARS